MNKKRLIEVNLHVNWGSVINKASEKVLLSDLYDEKIECEVKKPVSKNDIIESRIRSSSKKI